MEHRFLHIGGIVISYFLKTLMMILLVISVYTLQFEWIFGCGLGLFLSFIPTILNKNYKIHLPLILDILITLALFLHIGGVLLKAYTTIPQYDTMTHFVSSFIIAFLSFISIYILDEFWDGLEMDKYAMAFIVVFLTVALGVVWELAEWTSDIVFGTYEQWGYTDTIKDLFVDMMAGIVMAILGILLIRRGDFDEMADELGEGLGDMILKRNEQ
jgi:hypothetical protein